MCSIPGLPTPGTEVPVLIMRVNLNHNCGLVELWVNMDDGRKHVYEQMREEIQNPKSKFDGSEGQPGDLCLVCISDTWHRARIVSLQSETCNVFLIDQGQPHITTSEALAWGQRDSFLLPPETESCILANVLSLDNKWPERATEFLVSLPGKRFKGLVQHVLTPDRTLLLDIPMVSKPMCMFGVAKKMPVDEFRCLVQKCLEADRDSEISLLSSPEGNVNICMYKWPNICQNKTVEVYAYSIVGPHYFWLQYTNTEDLNMVSRLAQEAGQAQRDMTFPDTLGPGSLCLALFSSDKRWYRVQVIRRVEDAFNVLFIDYGNESDVDIKNVRSLPQSLLERPPQAFLCSLNGFDKSRGSWDDKVYDDFYNLLVDKLLRVTVLNMEDHSDFGVPQYAVEVECDNVVSNIVMQKYWKPFSTEHAKTEVAQTETSLQDSQTESNVTHLNVSKGNVNTCMYKEPNISKNKKEEVYASCIAHPHFFWCQYSHTEELNMVSRLAQEAGQAEQDMTFPETLGPGSPCLALFSSDEQWHRAQVICRVDDAFNVVFIDYGNESDIDIKNLRSLPQSLLERPPQAFLCSLNGFDKSRGSWDDKVYDDFYNLLVDKPLGVTVLNMDDHPEAAVPQYAVEVECEGAVVNTLMEKYWKALDTDHALEERLGSALDPDECTGGNQAVTELS